MFGNFIKPYVTAASLSVAAVLVSAPGASAVTLDYIGQFNGKKNVSATLSGTGHDSGTRSGSGGAFTMERTEDGTRFLAWCLDLFDWLATGAIDYTEDPANPFSGTNGPILGPDRVALIETFFETNATAVDAIYFGAPNNILSAAFQMALWELTYEDLNGSFDVTNGDFISNTTAINTTANDLLNNLTGPIQKNYKLTFWEPKDYDDKQNLVSISAVPLPAAGLLLFGALAGLGAVRRRRKG